MAKYAVGVEYDGSAFFGWQRQQQTPTVQAELEQAIATVANQEHVTLYVAGRTDTGVHAICQVAHFETQAIRKQRQWLLGINANLPGSCAVTHIQTVADDFHARYSAVSRSYRYIICNRWIRPALERDLVAWVHQPLDANLMQEAAGVLLGTHDFSSFRAAGCQAKTPVRTILNINIVREAERVIIDVTANGFLYHMVRNIAGSLIMIGKGQRPVDWLAEILAAKDRKSAGITAPPGGLYFMSVGYPEHFNLFS